MQSMITWIGIFFCLSQSAIFSGLNLAFFSLSRLRLEVEAEKDNPSAARVLAMRADANFLLTTILWGNVGINVLLTLLSDSVMAGVIAFAFSAIFITVFGEILPQAFCSRHALKMASMLAPVLKFYQILLYPVAKPSAWLLDKWLGKEGIHYWREQDLKQFIRKHIGSDSSDISHAEGTGAINFLAIDDLPIISEGQAIEQSSIISLPMKDGKLQFPTISRQLSDDFLQQVNNSTQPWIVLTDHNNQPALLLDVDRFLRDALFNPEINFIPENYCHRPIIVTDTNEPLAESIIHLKSLTPAHSDEPLNKDVVILWTPNIKKVITGADILGRLLKGIG